MVKNAFRERIGKRKGRGEGALGRRGGGSAVREGRRGSVGMLLYFDITIGIR
jgi:hypothetical protein